MKPADTLEGLLEVVVYLEDDIKRALAHSGHKEALQVALVVVKREIARKRRDPRAKLVGL